LDIFAYPATVTTFPFAVKISGTHNKLKQKFVIIVKTIAGPDYVTVITLQDYC